HGWTRFLRRSQGFQCPPGVIIGPQFSVRWLLCCSLAGIQLSHLHNASRWCFLIYPASLFSEGIGWQGDPSWACVLVHERPINFDAQNPEPGYLFQISIRQKMLKKSLSCRPFNQIARAVLCLLDVSIEDI